MLSSFRSLEANLFSSRRVGLGSKLKFYKSLVLPRLMYGAAERHRVRWLGHAACKPNDVMVKQLLFAHSIPGHPRPIGRPGHRPGHRHAQPRPHTADRPPTRLGEPSTAPGRVEGGGQPVLSFEQCCILFSSFPLLLAFVVGGLGFEFCVFVAGWRHALRSE